jgi:ketosteroid isomerase-like protein
MSKAIGDFDVIHELEDRRYAAMIAGDVATLDNLLSDQAVYTHSSGDRDTKIEYLDKVAAKQFIYHHIDRPEENILIEGDTAIVVGRMNARVDIGGSEWLLDNRSLAVWSRTGGVWRLLAYQPTVMKR